MKTQWIIEAEEGTTECKDCPFSIKSWDNYWSEEYYRCGAEKLGVDCHCGQYNMQTIKIIKQK